MKSSPEMNDLIRSIHGELLKLKTSIPWLSEYDDSCLWKSEGRNLIHYSPRDHEQTGPAPQQPAHLSVEYIPIDFDKKKRMKYSNSFEGIPDCEFPGLHAKIYGEALVWANRPLEERLKQIVIAKCRAKQSSKSKSQAPKKALGFLAHRREIGTITSEQHGGIIR